MPRRHNPRAHRRQAAALRAEHQRDQLIAARHERRAARRVELRLGSIESYRRLTRAMTDVAVQARIDTVELAKINMDRAQVGLPPLETLPLD